MRWVDWYGDASLHVLDVALACCSLEFDAAVPSSSPVPGSSSPAPGSSFPGPVEGRLVEPPLGGRTVVVISGTVTDRLAPAVASIVDAVRLRQAVVPVVVAYGVCACSGGPYWDSYAVTKGVDTLVGVDVYVPGCPPTPAALREVVDAVVGRVRP